MVVHGAVGGIANDLLWRHPEQLLGIVHQGVEHGPVWSVAGVHPERHDHPVLVGDDRALVAEEEPVLPLGPPTRVGVPVVGRAAGRSVVRIDGFVISRGPLVQDEIQEFGIGL
ncbi:hypothetical protein D3C87_1521530 [compost metagenome]